jgi:hypothetical protein
MPFRAGSRKGRSLRQLEGSALGSAHLGVANGMEGFALLR